MGGLVILLFGGKFLVKGAVDLALRFKISTLVVGMTVVSLGTSAPELFVSVKAALSGHPDIAIGNVVGSNIANFALVLAVTCMIFPISVSRNSIRIDWPVMMAASIVFYIFILTNGNLEIWEGVLFVAALIIFVIWLIRKSRKEGIEAQAEESEFIGKQSHSPLLKTILFVVLGCIGLAFGADWLVKGATGIAGTFGISERVIALTMIAVGTSIPELATSTIAAFKKHTDLALGNLIGSNIFNILGILGVSAIFGKGIKVNERILDFDIFWMLGISALIFPFMVSKKRLTRLEGTILLLIYIVYITVILKFVV
ncbi:MAG: calcium/sodium antiporter [Bacteroidota bacterium]